MKRLKDGAAAAAAKSAASDATATKASDIKNKLEYSRRAAAKGSAEHYPSHDGDHKDSSSS